MLSLKVTSVVRVGVHWHTVTWTNYILNMQAVIFEGSLLMHMIIAAVFRNNVSPMLKA